MISIWKYPLEIDDEQWIDIPRGAKFLSVGVQRGKVCLWVQVDSDAPKESQLIVMHGTGHPMKSDSMQFIGTVMLYDGDLVFHVFHPK